MLIDTSFGECANQIRAGHDGRSIGLSGTIARRLYVADRLFTSGLSYLSERLLTGRIEGSCDGDVEVPAGIQVKFQDEGKLFTVYW